MDEYSAIKVVNYLRQNGGSIETGLEFCRSAKSGLMPWDDEMFLIPADPDDSMLTVDYRQLIVEKSDLEKSNPNQGERLRCGTDGISHELDRLRKENLMLRRELELTKIDKEGREEITSMLKSETYVDHHHLPSPSTNTGHTDRIYFSSHEQESIHREMLADKVIFR